MAWIKTIGPADADDDLRRTLMKMRGAFPAEYRKGVPKASPTGESIVESHSLIPGALYHAFMTMSELMSGDLPLSRREHEMIATVVSETNDCFY